MHTTIRSLSPTPLWNYFSDLNTVPRPSKKEERVIAFMVDFGKSLGLETRVDPVGNVIIKKPASSGMEDRQTVVLQSHLDMVHQKNTATVFDFDTQGIEMYIDGDWVTAKDTTLGADNGLGVAAIMAVLADTMIKHPALEALFTIDEETGMTGAKGLRAGYLEGTILLNLDTEEDDEIDMGCAGGVDINIAGTYVAVEPQPESVGLAVTVRGLQGGHSGMDIHKGLGNANKIINRLLHVGSTHFGIQVAEIDGGGLRNAIPRESVANIAISASQKAAFLEDIATEIVAIQTELSPIEPNLKITLTPTSTPEKVLSDEAQRKLIQSVYAAQNGVYKMSTTMEDLVETSNNIARVLVKDGHIEIACLTRSSSESSKYDLANCLKATFELGGYDVSFNGDYPGWQPNIHSPILKVLSTQYEKLFDEKPKVVACHAGLECGILGQHYPTLDMVSFGPTIKGAHSPDERVSITSVQKFWKFFTTILENIPAKQ